MSLLSYFKRNIYKWHRLLSIIIAIPVIMWTVSGFMSPIMGYFKPKVKNQFLTSKSIDLSKVKVPLDSALLKNRIESISNFRLVELGGSVYYQIRKVGDNRLTYIDAQTAVIDSAAVENYAKKVAQKFLGDSTAKVTSVSFLQNFDEEYPESNRLLPVYRIEFDRKDNVRLYVDPVSDRLGLAMNDSRAVFLVFFRNFHSWQFLEKLGSFRSAVLVSLAASSFIAAVMGIYIVFITKSKKGSNSTLKYRRLHRQIAIVASVTMLMFSFSGAYHSIAKLEPDARQLYFMNDEFKAADLNFSFDSLAKRYPVKNISLAKLNGANYLRIVSAPITTNENTECCKKNMAVAKHDMGKQSLPPVVRYVPLSNLNELANGEELYAKSMACNFSRQSSGNMVSVDLVTEFNGEYGMMNKRLPVYKVQFNTNHNERWYVETSSGKLAAKVNDVDARERFSFSKLHMFHFSHGMGKATRDVLLAIAALVNLLAALAGTVLLVLWYKKKEKKRQLVKV